MHAAQESQLKRVGIIAGSGQLPELLASRLEQSSISPYIIALDGIAEPSLYQTREHAVIPVGMAGSMISWLKQNGIRDILMTGALKRPEWSKLKVDPRGLRVLTKILLKKSMGDDALLKTLRRELESEGFVLRGVQEFVPELLAPEGILGAVAPLPEDRDSIQLGFNAAKEHGRQDKGQAVVVQQDTVIGLEGADGTRALMLRAGGIKSQGRGPILVKVCKPQQDKALDMPTIGEQTVETARNSGFSGIVVEAGETLIIDLQKVVELCNLYNMFLIGIRNNA